MDGALGHVLEEAAGDSAPPRLPVDDLRAYLRGSWRLTRQIRDHRAYADGAFEGSVSLTDCREGLHYREEGELSIAGYRGAAWRCYLFHFPSSGRAEVTFPGGRHFHNLDLRSGTWDALHRCGQDSYRGSFEACAEDRLRVTWRIQGPRKDLLLDSWLTREGRAEDAESNPGSVA